MNTKIISKWSAMVAAGIIVGQVWAMYAEPGQVEDRFLIEEGMFLDVNEVKVSRSAPGLASHPLRELVPVDTTAILIVLGPECGRPYGELIKWGRTMRDEAAFHDAVVLWLGVSSGDKTSELMGWGDLSEFGSRVIDNWQMAFVDLDLATSIGIEAFPQVLVLDESRRVVFSAVGSAAIDAAMDFWKTSGIHRVN